MFPHSSVAVHSLVKENVPGQAPAPTISLKSMVTLGSQLSVAVTSVPVVGAGGNASHETVTSIGTPDKVGAVISSTVMV